MTARPRRLALLAALSVLVLVGFVLAPPIPQDPAYHNFADQRTLLGVPHMWNVVSNLPFALIGVIGCWLLVRPGALPDAFEHRWEKGAWLAFFLGEVLTGFGSAYYHLEPNNHTLVLDRLFLIVLPAAVFTIVVAEHLSKRAGRLMLAPMVVLGVASVLNWHWSESAGQGDLRLYIAVQFYPMLVVPLIILLFPSRYTESRQFLLLWALYVIARVCEVFDSQIYDLGLLWSGHTLKHLIAAGATCCLVHALRRRRATARL